MDKTLYVSDLDGTLLNSHARLSPTAVQTINHLVAQGVLFTYATARSFSTAQQATGPLSLQVPVITYNGVFLVNPATGKPLEILFMPPAGAALVLEEAARQGLQPLVYAMVDGEEKVSWPAGKESPGIRQYLAERKNDSRLRPVQSPTQLAKGRLFYITLIGTQGQVGPVLHTAQQVPGLGCHVCQDVYHPEQHWLEIYRQDANKQNATLRLKNLLGAGQVIGFGDNTNDLPLFAACDEGYAVANAHPGLKAVATGVIGSNNEDGVPHWLASHAL